MPERRHTVLAVVAAAAVLVATAAFGWGPALTREREVLVATPSPPGLFNRLEVRLRPGEHACLTPVPLTPNASAVRVIALARPGADAVLGARVSGPDRRFFKGGQSSGWATGRDAVVTVEVGAPPVEGEGQVCLYNEGEDPFALIASDEPRTFSATRTSVNDEPGPQVALSLVDPRPASTLDRLGTVVDRASQLSGGVAPTWLLWPLLVLMALGVPAAVLVALADAARGRDDGR